MSLLAPAARLEALARLVRGHAFEARRLADGRTEFTWADDAFETFFGCRRPEVNRRGWERFVDPRDLPEARERLAAVFAGDTREIEARIVGADEQVRWLRIAAEPIRGARGRVLGILGVAEEITARKALMQQMLEAVDREQRRIGVDLHDGLGQVLTGIKFLLHGLAAEAGHGQPVSARQLNRASALVGSAIESTRRIAHGLSPGVAEFGGLPSALDSLVRQTRDWYRLKVIFHQRRTALPALEPAAADHLFRIAQEALTNVVRHARASRAVVRLAVHGNELVLSVTDDGRGLPARARPGFGLRSLQYRAAAIGARLRVGAARGGGTRVEIRWPLECPARADRPAAVGRRKRASGGRRGRPTPRGR